MVGTDSAAGASCGLLLGQRLGASTHTVCKGWGRQQGLGQLRAHWQLQGSWLLVCSSTAANFSPRHVHCSGGYTQGSGGVFAGALLERLV